MWPISDSNVSCLWSSTDAYEQKTGNRDIIQWTNFCFKGCQGKSYGESTTWWAGECLLLLCVVLTWESHVRPHIWRRNPLFLYYGKERPYICKDVHCYLPGHVYMTIINATLFSHLMTSGSHFSPHQKACSRKWLYICTPVLFGKWLNHCYKCRLITI